MSASNMDRLTDTIDYYRITRGYTVHSTIYTVYFTLYPVHCTLYIDYPTLYTLHCALYTAYSVHSTMYTVSVHQNLPLYYD